MRTLFVTLCDYIQQGNSNAAAGLLNQNPGLASARMHDGLLPLEAVLANRDIDAVAMLRAILPHADIYAVDSWDIPFIENVMIEACDDGELHGLTTLLDAGLSPNTIVKNDGLTLLMRAAYSSVEVTRILLQQGASVNLQDRRGWTALMYASALDSSSGACDEADLYSIVRDLLVAGADVSLRNADGLAAIDIAQRQNWSPNLAAAVAQKLRLAHE